MRARFGRGERRTGAAWLAAAVFSAGSGACGGDPADSTRASAPLSGASAASPDGGVCAGARTLTCTYFDGATGAWSTTPPQRVSLAETCAPGGSHGEIDAFIDTRGQYWLDSLGFRASGSAVRVSELTSSDAVGGVTYGCGHGGGAVLTKLFCGQDIGSGTLTVRFDFAGHWEDGTPWTRYCDAQIDVAP